uniref:Uncharacterized protein LOC100373886 n=1 Tax=Saccoglossus kowalevskii TaxID=10224 RepID=A0ABM0GXT5_SACKO|nr:PREDICTED: uncharacterized protein LOC100373886 [Saccoglossus kowalevskii]
MSPTMLQFTVVMMVAIIVINAYDVTSYSLNEESFCITNEPCLGRIAGISARPVQRCTCPPWADKCMFDYQQRKFLCMDPSSVDVFPGDFMSRLDTREEK